MQNNSGATLDLTSLRDVNGYFTSPNYFSNIGSPYSTALYLASGGKLSLTEVQRKEISKSICQSSDKSFVQEPWFSWSLSVLIKEENISRPSCLQTAPPKVTNDPSVDIPYLYAWAYTQDVVSNNSDWKVLLRKSNVLKESLPSSAYVTWRKQELLNMAAINNDGSGKGVAPPQSLKTPSDLLNLWGFLEMCSGDLKCISRVTQISDDEVSQAQEKFGDDLSLLAALRVSSIRKSHEYINNFSKNFESRESPQGMIRSGRVEGDTPSTFLVLEIAPQLFPGGNSSVTVEDARQRLNLMPDGDVALRLEAIAIIKAEKGDLTPYNNEIRDAQSLVSNSLNKNNLRAAIKIIEALRLISPNVTKPSAPLFDVTSDSDRSLALAELSNSDMFSNQKSIQDKWGTLVQDIPTHNYSGKALFEEVSAAAGAGISFTPSEQSEVASKLAKYRGCKIDGKMKKSLYRADENSDSPCSLEATWLAQRSGLSPQ